MKRPLNFAVVGCGMFAQSFHLPNINRSAKAKLHVCCARSDATLNLVRDKFKPVRITKDYRAAIADPAVDVICLSTTEKIRLEVIEIAAEFKKPVYCEKPLARTLAEMYEIRKVVQQSGIPFCVGHNRRSSPAMVAAQKIFRQHMANPKPCLWRFDREGKDRPVLAEDGVAGMSVRINDDWWSWKGWVFDKEQAPHGAMLFEMTHFTDVCNWFLASEPVEVIALENGMLNHGIVIRYAGGEMATISMSANGTFGYPKELYEVFGNGAAVVVDHMLEIRTAGIEGVPARQTFPMIRDEFPGIGPELGLSGWLKKRAAACQEAVEKNNTALVLRPEPDKGWAHQLDAFVDEINGEGPQVCGVDDAIRATRIAFAAIKSSHKRRVVPVAEV
ncbi:MAG: Myo-inositol 2-dehydrogenase [Verrucomicrobiae bacterium]|nr:Myo-inositol 2-dehydrogenase [Verrucomicrobiae bacterium]